MKYFIICILIGLVSSCEKKTSQDIPIEEIPEYKEETRVSIEAEIRMLRTEVTGVNKVRVFENLDESEKIEFDKRFSELRKSLNTTISLLKTKYTNSEKRELESSYFHTKSIWDYLTRNYRI